MTQASIFLVEDEALIRMMLVEMIAELGHKVIAEAGSVNQARSLAETERYDLAILDINLQGTNVQPVAEVVRDRGALLFPKWLWQQRPADGFDGMPVLVKPCTPDTLKRTIEAVLPNGEPEETQDKRWGRRKSLVPRGRLAAQVVQGTRPGMKLMPGLVLDSEGHK